MYKEPSPAEDSAQLKAALRYYLYCLLALLFCMLPATLSANVYTLSFFAIAYTACGIFLNIQALRALINWHKIYDTLPNVASEKLSFILLWPIKYLILFAQIGITRYL